MPLFLLIAALSFGQQFVSKEERAAESALIQSFGIKAIPLPEHPYRLPFSSRSLIVPQAYLREVIGEKKSTVPADLLRQDLPLLRAVMAKNYAGWRLAAARGWNWEQWFENWDHLLSRHQGENLSLTDALQPIAELEEFLPDNYSGPIADIYFGSGSRSATLRSAPNGACTAMRMRSAKIFPMDSKDRGQQPRQALLSDFTTQVWYLSYPSRRGDIAAVQCGRRWIEAIPVYDPRGPRRERNILELSQTMRDGPSYRALTPRISYLRVPTGDKLNERRMDRLMAALSQSPPREDVLIWDLRSHGGGEPYWSALNRWLDPEKVEKFALPRAVRRSCLTAALQWNAAWFRQSGLKPPIPNEQEVRLQELAVAVARPGPAGCPDTLEVEKSNWNYSQRTLPTQARFLVLVDNRCGSDCEKIVNLLASEPRTVVAGVNTYGACQYELPGYFVLPNSRLAFRTALAATNVYGDNRSVDGYGLNVDVLLRTMEDQSAAGIRKLAETLLAPVN